MVKKCPFFSTFRVKSVQIETQTQLLNNPLPNAYVTLQIESLSEMIKSSQYFIFIHVKRKKILLGQNFMHCAKACVLLMTHILHSILYKMQKKIHSSQHTAILQKLTLMKKSFFQFSQINFIYLMLVGTQNEIFLKIYEKCYMGHYCNF